VITVRLVDWKNAIPDSFHIADTSNALAATTAMTTTTVSSLPRVKSESHMKNLHRNMGLESNDERGVHGGIPSARPGMQESMIFLRKLFTHQHDGGDQIPSLLSPPDSPMRTFTKIVNERAFYILS
jgi:hypothetical protein